MFPSSASISDYQRNQYPTYAVYKSAFPKKTGYGLPQGKSYLPQSSEDGLPHSEMFKFRGDGLRGIDKSTAKDILREASKPKEVDMEALLYAHDPEEYQKAKMMREGYAALGAEADAFKSKESKFKYEKFNHNNNLQTKKQEKVNAQNEFDHAAAGEAKLADPSDPDKPVNQAAAAEFNAMRYTKATAQNTIKQLEAEIKELEDKNPTYEKKHDEIEQESKQLKTKSDLFEQKLNKEVSKDLQKKVENNVEILYRVKSGLAKLRGLQFNDISNIKLSKSMPFEQSALALLTHYESEPTDTKMPDLSSFPKDVRRVLTREIKKIHNEQKTSVAIPKSGRITKDMLRSFKEKVDSAKAKAQALKAQAKAAKAPAQAQAQPAPAQAATPAQASSSSAGLGLPAAPATPVQKSSASSATPLPLPAAAATPAPATPVQKSSASSSANAAQPTPSLAPSSAAQPAAQPAGMIMNAGSGYPTVGNLTNASTGAVSPAGPAGAAGPPVLVIDVIAQEKLLKAQQEQQARDQAKAEFEIEAKANKWDVFDASSLPADDVQANQTNTGKYVSYSVKSNNANAPAYITHSTTAAKFISFAKEASDGMAGSGLTKAVLGQNHRLIRAATARAISTNKIVAILLEPGNKHIVISPGSKPKPATVPASPPQLSYAAAAAAPAPAVAPTPAAQQSLLQQLTNLLSPKK
jgi:hypothetical protein